MAGEPKTSDASADLVLLVKGIIAVAGALLLVYGGWILALTVYSFLPEQQRPFAQSIAGVAFGIFLIVFAFLFLDRLVKKRVTSKL